MSEQIEFRIAHDVLVQEVYTKCLTYYLLFAGSFYWFDGQKSSLEL